MIKGKVWIKDLDKVSWELKELRIIILIIALDHASGSMVHDHLEVLYYKILDHDNVFIYIHRNGL